MNKKLDVVVVPVSDVDRAKDFYARLGFREDVDFAGGDGYRVVQMTPPGSPCSSSSASGSLPPGRARSTASYVEATEVVHDAGGGVETVAPRHDWWDWYAAYMDARGRQPDEASAAAGRYMADVEVVARRG